ncbi:hypothetical protein [Cognaticolwellia aestuarii]|uniref:hypothetical protein n=1 Tax=Cognaticolwellia aestuarii TaxID=329993 RepID=UPI000984D72A|nr:hypothetical protein [Cognaticolwellia aestuarii]
MRLNPLLSKLFASLAVVSFLSACGGGSEKKEETTEELFTLTISGPDSVYSWQPIDVSVISNKPEAEYFCQWSYDRLTWFRPSNNECSYTPKEVTENTVITVEVNAFYQGEEITFEQDIDINYQYHLNHNQRVVANNVLLVQNQMINLADTSFDLAEKIADSPENQTLGCGAEGNYQVSFYDNNTDLIVSSGDEIHVDFQSCFLKSMDAMVNGQLDINIGQVSETGQPDEIEVTLTDLAINVGSFYQVEEIIASGKLAGARSRTDIQTITRLNSTELDFDSADKQPLHITDVATEKIENYETAQIQLQLSGNIEQKSTSAFYSVAYLSPLNAPFGAFPTSGEIIITNTENIDDVLLINTTDSYMHGQVFQLVDNGQEAIILNAEHYNGNATYQLSALDEIYIKNYQEQDLRLLGINSPKDDFEVMDSFTFILSQPISSIEGQMHFANMTNGFHQTSGATVFSGSKITGTPNELLQAASEYSISLPAITSQTGASKRAFGLSKNVLISNNIVPVISLSQGYFSELSTPVLSARQSAFKKGTEFSYLWQTTDNLNVIFDTENAVETEIQIGSDVNQDINLQLTITNDLGNRAITEKPLRYLDINASYMLIIGSQESYVAEGESWPLNDKDGEFTLSTKPYEEAEKTRSFISVNYQGLDSWDLKVEAPTGTNLTIGRYEGATRYPFQNEDVAGLSFGGQHRGCNISFSDFEIYEIAFDSDMNLTKLALDFDLACEQSGRERLQGTVRINSGYPMVLN